MRSHSTRRAASGDVERRRAHADDFQSRRYRGNVCRHARAIAGAIDECRTDKKTRAQARHGDDRAEQRWPRQRNDPWLTDCWRTPYLILRLINSDSMDLPWRAAVVRFPTGHPSSALPDTDGRHDRTGYGTWMLLAVFVARDDRPWLSVTGTCASGFGLVVSGMDPRACDGWTTVCPLWLLGAASPDSTLSIAGYRLAPSNFVTANCSASTPSRQRTLSITISLPPGPLPYAYD